MNVELSETVQDDGDVFRVHSSIYTDPSIFDLEMERLFHGSWVYVGHEAEIPLPGDYKTGVVGRYPVIVSRDPQQNVHVLLNRCMHRGAIVCRESRGHSNHFRCTYHNWVYSNDGTLVGPAQKSGYPDDFDKERLALVSAPRVEYYRGLIFASFNAEVEPLNARLAAVRPYIDAWCDRSPVGRVSLPNAVHRYEYPATGSCSWTTAWTATTATTSTSRSHKSWSDRGNAPEERCTGHATPSRPETTRRASFEVTRCWNVSSGCSARWTTGDTRRTDNSWRRLMVRSVSTTS